MGSGRGFGVELDGERGDVEALETLDDLVVEADVADPDASELRLRGRDRLPRGGVDREAVVLTGDLDATGRDVEDGLVRPAVAEGQLEDRKSTRLNSSHVKISY